MNARLRLGRIWLLLFLAAIAGCGPSEPKLKPVFPVRGSIFVNGKPASGAVVMFHPLPLPTGKTHALTSRGTVNSDGDFTLTTYNTDDGAPEGDYAVAVYWPGKRTGKGDDESSDLPPDRLGLRYSNPATSSLKYRVAAPETKLERFNLK